MLGFIIGTACLIGLIKVLRGPRWAARAGWGMGWGRRSRVLRRVFSRLETSPSQENVIVDALAEVRAGGSKVMPEIAATRAEIARILREDVFDSAALEPVYARHDAALTELRSLTTTAMGKVHSVLDARQRRELAAIIERRGFFWDRGHRGPYRTESVAA